MHLRPSAQPLVELKKTQGSHLPAECSVIEASEPAARGVTRVSGAQAEESEESCNDSFKAFNTQSVREEPDESTVSSCLLEDAISLEDAIAKTKISGRLDKI